jgi:DNA-binding IscR family transcriptional regulator
MAANTRFAVAIHTAGMLALAEKMRVNSETIARSLSTNPVVVRRVISLLAKHGLVDVRKGQAGGAALSRLPGEITLEEIYRAMQQQPLMAVPKSNADGVVDCPIAKCVAPVLTEFFANAEAGFLQRLSHFTLADVMAAVEQRMADQGICRTPVKG